MLNRVILMGRIVNDLELSFTIAVDRNFVKQGEERQTDFIDCVAWRQQAEFITRYFGKGRMIALEGNLRKRVWEDKNGSKHYVTEVYVDNVSFTGEKAQNNGQGGYQNNGYQNNNGYRNNGYQQNGGYNQGGYQNNSYQHDQGYQNQAPMPQQPDPSQGVPNIGDMVDFDGQLNDNGVPF